MNTPYEDQTVFYWLVEVYPNEPHSCRRYIHQGDVVFTEGHATRYQSQAEAQRAGIEWEADLPNFRRGKWRAYEHGFVFSAPAGFDPLMELVELVSDCRDDQLNDREYEDERLALLNAEIKALRVDAERYRAANMQIDAGAPSNIIGGPRNE